MMEPTAPAKTKKDEEVVTVSRSTVYFILTAVVFFIIGYGVAWFSFNTASNAMQEVVRDVVSEALAEANLNGGGAAAAAQPTALPAVVENVSVDDDPSIGAEDAPVVIVEFSDYRCPYCQRFQEQTLNPLLEQYAGQIRLVYRDFPVVGGGAVGRLAAEAAECADDQGKYWEYHDALFANQQDLSEEALIRYAGELDLDVEVFTACLQNDTHAEEVQNDYLDGFNYGVSGTPTFFINGRRLVGAQPLAAFQQVIEEALQEVGG